MTPLPADHPYVVALHVNAMRQALHQPLLPLPPAPAGYAGGEDAGAAQVAAVRARVEAMAQANPRGVVDPVAAAGAEAAIRAAAGAITEAVAPDATSEAAQRLQEGLQAAIAAQLRTLGQPAPKPPVRAWEPPPIRRGTPIGPTI